MPERVIIERAVADRLAALQRRFSESMRAASPIDDLLQRLHRYVDATTALVDRSGRAIAQTGPLPFAALVGELVESGPECQTVTVGGWGAVAALVGADEGDTDSVGWLVAASRRDDFPAPGVESAAQVAATVVESIRRVDAIRHVQERGVRTVLLEQALALAPTRHDDELAARISAVGLRFGDDLRVIVIRPRRAGAGQRAQSPAAIASGLVGALRTAGVGELTAVRDDVIVVLAQSSPATVRRVLVAAGLIDRVYAGVGRRVEVVGDVADSFHDAQLALRAVGRARHQDFVAYEDFDFATRLFADVGLDRMVAWAEEFLRPLDGRDALTDTIRAYLDHDQNVKEAAAALHLHHNSMRYRLTKVEEALGIRLQDPAAVASTYLAMTAVGLVGGSTARVSRRPRTGTEHQDVDIADVSIGLRRGPGGSPGVTFDPER
jgi:hypothetical protein